MAGSTCKDIEKLSGRPSGGGGEFYGVGGEGAEGVAMKDMTKSQRRHLNELAGRAYECELSHAIDLVHQEIQKWKNNEVSFWDVHQKIHSYHDNEARSLYKTYVMLNDPRVAVAQAVVKGILDISEVKEDCRALLEGLIAYYRQ